MTDDRIEKSTHLFWLNTCGINTHRRGSALARHDTPWNAFSKDDVLVCTLWNDQIVTVFDPLSQTHRRFIKLGGKKKKWKGPAVTHGAEADARLKRASKEKLRVVGYEAEPDAGSLASGDRKVAHFYLDRAHELSRIFELSGGDMLKRLHIEDAFTKLPQTSTGGPYLEPGYLFELVEPKGNFPGKPADDAVDDDGEGEDKEDDEDANALTEDEESKATTEEFAIKAVSILIEHVLEQKDNVLHPLTYKQLAVLLDRRNKHGEIWARGLGYILGKVTNLIEGIQPHYPEEIPYLTSIVVGSKGQNEGLPGTGVKNWWPGYEKLSRPDRQAIVHVAYKKVMDFSNRWNDVLTLLGLPAIVPGAPTSSSTPGTQGASAGGTGGEGGWGGGESEQHKALKNYVLNNPQRFGAETSWDAWPEHVLRSGDAIDVFFRSADVLDSALGKSTEVTWVGVEVKSSISDGLISDYERGIYQAVKYKAVLQAQAKIDRPENPPRVRVYLVLESNLPDIYRKTADTLGVAVVSNIKSDAKPVAKPDHP